MSRDLLLPHSVQRGWVVRYKLLRGRVFVHAEDRGLVLYNPSCSACVLIMTVTPAIAQWALFSLVLDIPC